MSTEAKASPPSWLLHEGLSKSTPVEHIGVEQHGHGAHHQVRQCHSVAQGAKSPLDSGTTPLEGKTPVRGKTPEDHLRGPTPFLTASISTSILLTATSGTPPLVRATQSPTGQASHASHVFWRSASKNWAAPLEAPGMLPQGESNPEGSASHCRLTSPAADPHKSLGGIPCGGGAPLCQNGRG